MCTENGKRPGYGKLWGGRDATFSLAMVSLDAKDSGKLDWKWADLPEENVKSLKSWREHFAKKYDVVGVLKEYEGADWSPLGELTVVKQEATEEAAES